MINTNVPPLVAVILHSTRMRESGVICFSYDIEFLLLFLFTRCCHKRLYFCFSKKKQNKWMTNFVETMKSWLFRREGDETVWWAWHTETQIQLTPFGLEYTFFLFIWVKQTTINLINKTVLKGFSVSDNIPSVSSIDVNSLCRSVPIVVTWLVCLPDLDCLNTRSEDITYLFKIYKGKTMNNRWRKWSIHTNVTGNLNQIVKTSQTRRNH